MTYTGYCTLALTTRGCFVSCIHVSRFCFCSPYQSILFHYSTISFNCCKSLLMTIEPPATAPVAHEPTTSTEAKCNSRSSSQVRSASRPRATAAAGAAATGPAATIPLALNLTPDLEAIAHLKPLTCGGKAISTDMVHLALTEQHLGQESNDLNFALWDVLRVNMRQSELWEQYEVWDKVANG